MAAKARKTKPTSICEIEFEPNCGNEGWVHCELREPVRTTIPLRQVRR